MSEETAGFLTAPATGTPYDDGSEMEKMDRSPTLGSSDGHLVDGGPGNTKPAS